MMVHHVYLHPDQGPILVLSGQDLVDGRVSNWWEWKALATGKKKSGYGGDWPDITKYYEVTVEARLLDEPPK